MIPADRHRRSAGFVRVHRYSHQRIPGGPTVERRGLRALRPADALLGAWSILPADRPRAPVIDAVRIGLIDTDQLSSAVAARSRLKGRAELRGLIALLRAGCQSEPELMGFRSVFNDRRLPPSVMQFEVTIGVRKYVLDVAWPDLLIAVMLDGAAYHGSSDAREHDVRRDSALAQAGWLTVRITYERLLHDPHGIVEELLYIVATRRRQLGISV